MAFTVVLPKQGMTMVEGTVTEWFVDDGDTVELGQPLFSFETEKVNYDVAAEAAGILSIVASVDSTLDAGAVTGYILDPGESPPEASAAPAPAAPKAVDAPKAADARPAPSQPKPAAPGERVKASPAAKRIAAERGVDIASVQGSGPGGRIVVEDVEKAAAAPQPAAAPLEGAIPYRGMRRTVGQRMHDSLQDMAQLTLVTEADMTDAIRLRRDLLEAWEGQGLRVTYTHMVIRAVALSLRDFPRVNVTLDGDVVRVQSAVHVAFAVSLDEGLIAPVIPNADTKSLREIALESGELSRKAREGGLSPDDVTGGTFTVTALGMLDIDAFTPIINPPQAAILGVGRVADRPVFVGETGTQIERRSFMALSLTIDHRILDGAPAAEFLRIVRRYLERPSLLLLDGGAPAGRPA